ncbi:MAG: N-6 DNA methylase [Dehalococcoidales bacterium]|nr:N-6 DNA methylase [Dehalococcoidales bacterium]
MQSRFLVDEDGKVYEPIGDVYENFVSTIFRGENGQYFTPRPVVDFIIKMTGIEWGEEGMVVCDPCCGSGGFLLYVFEKMDRDLKKEFMNENMDFKNKKAEEQYRAFKDKLCNELLVGYDNERSIANTAMMNMSVHGDGSVGIYYGNSLLKTKTRQILPPNSFDCVVTNPPFSLSVKKNTMKDSDERDVLEEYDLGHSHRYNMKTKQFETDPSIKDIRGSQDSKKLFIERCYHLLKSKKYLGIVLDDGVLNNPSDAYLRDWIYNHFLIKAVVSLPFEIFRERGATNRTSILILQKNDGNMIQKDIFMAIAEHAGENYGKLGWKMPNNLDEIYQEWLRYNSEEKSSFRFSFIVKNEELENFYDDKEKVYRNRLDPKYYNPKFKALINKIEKNKNVDSIGNLVDFVEEICKPDDVNAFGSKYVEKITKNNQIEIGEIDGINDPKGKEDRVFKAGDLVASRINIKSGMIAFVPDNIEEIRATSEYYKFVPKLDESGKPKVLKEYLFIALISNPMQMIMDALATGQYMRLKEEELAKIKIPVPKLPAQEVVIKKFRDERAKVFALQQDVTSKAEVMNKQIEELIIGQAE